jgi:cytochrome P450
VVNEPKLARSILIGDWERFPKATLLRQSLHPAIGSGVLGSVGEEWKRQRRMIDPALDQRGMEELFPLMAAPSMPCWRASPHSLRARISTWTSR